MTINRSEFLHLSGSALAALMFSRFSCEKPPGKIETYGLQLYSVRDAFEKDPEATIRQIATMGYRQLESYERNDDFLWGLSPGGFKNLMDELGMSLVSTHCEPGKDFERKIDQAAETGMRYLIYNWPFEQQPLDEYRKKAGQFNLWGELCRKAGLRFGYHNYSSSYQLVEGVYPQDLLLQGTDPALVYHQMDIYWVWRAGQDPRRWLQNNPGRYKLFHIKDGDKQETCLLGKGGIDLQSILEAGLDNGVEYFIVEQEHYQQLDPMESARSNAEYMREVF